MKFKGDSICKVRTRNKNDKGQTMGMWEVCKGNILSLTEVCCPEFYKEIEGLYFFEEVCI